MDISEYIKNIQVLLNDSSPQLYGLPKSTKMVSPQTYCFNNWLQLIELCLQSTYFQFHDTFYEQTDGAAMGSPLSPIVGNLFMAALETELFKHFHRVQNLGKDLLMTTFVLWQH